MIVQESMSLNARNGAPARAAIVTGNPVEPHGLTAVAPLHTLRRAEPSEAHPPSPRLRRVPTSHSSTGLHPWLSAKEGKRSMGLGVEVHIEKLIRRRRQ